MPPVVGLILARLKYIDEFVSLSLSLLQIGSTTAAAARATLMTRLILECSWSCFCALQLHVFFCFVWYVHSLSLSCWQLSTNTRTGRLPTMAPNQRPYFNSRRRRRHRHRMEPIWKIS